MKPGHKKKMNGFLLELVFCVERVGARCDRATGARDARDAT